MIATIATRIPTKAELLGDDPHCTKCGRDLVIGNGVNAACMFKLKLYCQICYRDVRSPKVAPAKQKRRRRGNRRRVTLGADVAAGQLIANFLASLSSEEKGYALSLLLNMAKVQRPEVIQATEGGGA